jgi:protein disulfide-isomerase A6
MRISLTSVLFPLSALLVSAVAAESNVLELNPDNWDAHIGKGTPALVEFFAPWCGHCKNLAPVYEELADAFAHVKDKIIIAKVDADGAGKPLGQKFGVTGYPTLKWFYDNGKEEPYEGGRDLDAFVSHIERKVNVKSKIPPPPPSNVQVLDIHSWDEVVGKSDKNILVSFTAPWCGHCKSLKPIYEKVATTFKPEADCVVANLDANDEKNADLSKKYEIQGFPTLKFFSKGQSEPITYEGGRSEVDLVNFLNEKCDTQRKVGGGLNEKAGRLRHLDAFARTFFKSTSDAERLDLVAATLDADTPKGEAKYYVYVMNKVVGGKGNEYVEKESKRLSKILAKQNISVKKADEIQVKVNILKAFVEGPLEEDEEMARDTADL